MTTTPELERRAAEAERKQAQAAADLDHARRNLDDEANDARLGADGAEGRAAELAGTVAGCEEALRAAGAELGRHRAALEKRRREEEQEAERERHRRVPVLDEHAQRVAQEIDRVAAQLGALMAELVDTSRQLGLSLATPEAQRVLGLAAVQARLRDHLARHFEYSPPMNPAYAARFGAQAASTRLLDWPVNHLSPELRRPLAEKTREAHDGVVRVFATREAAEAAALRIGEPDRHHPVRTPAGTWLLLTGTLRGAAARDAASDARRPGAGQRAGQPAAAGAGGGA